MPQVPSIHACIPKGETPFRLGAGNNLWDVVYVGNVAFAHALAVKNLLTSKSAHGEAMVSFAHYYCIVVRHAARVDSLGPPRTMSEALQLSKAVELF